MGGPLTYHRIGSCNNCGECCQIVSQTRIMPCIQYNPDSPQHCLIYNKRGKTCKEYPKSPVDLAGRPHCSYQFIDDKGRIVKPTDDPLYFKRYLRIISR